MSVKRLIQKQRLETIDQTTEALRDVVVPPKGWIHFVRNALRMNTHNLAERLGVTNRYIYSLQSGEAKGTLTLNKMEEVANALNCRFVYAIVPKLDFTIESIINKRALKMAMEIVRNTHVHMALEDQAISPMELSDEMARVAEEILETNPSAIWDKP